MMSSLSVLEAFGEVWVQPRLTQTWPTLIIEEREAGQIRRFFVPRDHVSDCKWLLRGSRVYVFRSHSFVEQRTRPNLCLIPCQACLGWLVEDHFRCRDCGKICRRLDERSVQKDCPKPRILYEEVEFPYD